MLFQDMARLDLRAVALEIGKKKGPFEVAGVAVVGAALGDLRL
jgi:hypothetical protein